MTIYRSDFETVGFLRSEIIPFLREHGIDITSALEVIRNAVNNSMQQSETVEPALPDWRELVAHWSTLNTTDCAEVMLDLNPAANQGYGFYDNNEDFHTWRKTIENACGSGALPAKGQDGDWRVTPAALIDWCERYGYKCPLRMPRDASRTVKAETERDQLQKEVERLQAKLLEVADRSDENGREADRLRARVATLEAKAPQYLDPSHGHYSPRLAAAVRAWEAVSSSGVINGRVKKALSEWLTRYTDDFGSLSAEEIKQCAYVANWKTSGGRAKGTTDESD
jgi:hypothetical protein